MSFAGGGKDTRGTQIFITLGEVVDSLGGALWERPFAKVIKGMEMLEENINFEYGDMPPWGTGPRQDRIWGEGYGYLEKEYPKLTYIRSCELL